jgi:hypothetical protein
MITLTFVTHAHPGISLVVDNMSYIAGNKVTVMKACMALLQRLKILCGSVPLVVHLLGKGKVTSAHEMICLHFILPV